MLGSNKKGTYFKSYTKVLYSVPCTLHQVTYAYLVYGIVYLTLYFVPGILYRMEYSSLSCTLYVVYHLSCIFCLGFWALDDRISCPPRIVCVVPLILYLASGAILFWFSAKVSRFHQVFDTVGDAHCCSRDEYELPICTMVDRLWVGVKVRVSKIRMVHNDPQPLC